MISSSIKAVFVSVYGFSGAFDITVEVHYFSGKISLFKFSSWNSDDLPIQAVSSVPRSVSSFIDRCICDDCVTITVGTSKRWVTYSIGDMFRPIKLAAHA